MRVGGMLQALLVSGIMSCSPMQSQNISSSVGVGNTLDEVLAVLPKESLFAVSCDRVTYFPIDQGFEDCLSRANVILIYRDDENQYSYHINDGRVEYVEASNFTKTYP